MMEYAIHPYNFVPFYTAEDGSIVPPHRKPLFEYFTGDLKSGWLDVKLIAKSLLIVPNAAYYQEEKVGEPRSPGDQPKMHKTYEFYHVPDGEHGVRYAIPGSELRGMLRSAYETVTNSCLPFLLNDKPISLRPPIYAALPYRGLLEYDPKEHRWRLYQTRNDRIKTKGFEVKSGVYYWERKGEAFHTAQKVRYTLGEQGVTDLGKGPHEGWLQFNIPVNTKGNYNVRILIPEKVEYEWPIGDQDAYNSIHTSVKDTVNNMENKGPTTQLDLQKALERAKNGEGNLVPVYYLRVSRNGAPLIYCSGAAAGRVHQKRKWADIMGAHSPCQDQQHLCPACALFGTDKPERIEVGTDGETSRFVGSGARGRLRFTDALTLKEPERSYHTLQILSEPHPSSFEFYLRQPDNLAIYWNYDYYGKKDEKTNYDATKYCDLPNATPRGRKYYWHSEKTAKDGVRNTKEDHMMSTMEAVSAGTEFCFRIYFDRITDEQLSELIWLISLGENLKDSSFQHKLGHAKPLGYGSVKLLVTDCVIRELSYSEMALSMHTRRQIVSDHPICKHLPIDNRTLQSYLKMCNAASTGHHEVAYLTGIHKEGKKEIKYTEEIYAWFTYNRRNANSVLRLPEPLDSVLTLPTRRRKGDNRLQTQEEYDSLAILPKESASETSETRDAVDAVTSSGMTFQMCGFYHPVGETLTAEVVEVRQGEVRLRLEEIPYPGILRPEKKKKRSFVKGETLQVKISQYDGMREQIKVKL